MAQLKTWIRTLCLVNFFQDGCLSALEAPVRLQLEQSCSLKTSACELKTSTMPLFIVWKFIVFPLFTPSFLQERIFLQTMGIATCGFGISERLETVQLLLLYLLDYSVCKTYFCQLHRYPVAFLAHPINFYAYQPLHRFTNNPVSVLAARLGRGLGGARIVAEYGPYRSAVL